ncbi:hypothetical protein CXB51_009725 [Gossypium anomalum]|uniref:GH18 domain-containing protein n=1 Tax=Gossypium anomalum TaxID=47600 RepID=A0A8J5ZC37_9ROSI|nr:hypothetical protein CXB51_009725 [Gossypium anomalum]
MAIESAILLAFATSVILVLVTGIDAGDIAIYWGGGAGSYYLASSDDARHVATYLWNNFLGDNRPLDLSVMPFWTELILISKLEQTNIGMILRSISPDGDISNLENAWKQWTTNVPATKIFLGLPASPKAAGSGFIPVLDIASQVLPAIRGSAKYGSVML